jgi:IclR family acetate operon transcriptional repressor
VPDSKTINSIIKGARVLRGLANGINRISNLSEELQLSKSNVHRLLKSLEITGMAVQDPLTRCYYLGPLCLELATHPSIAHQGLTNCAFDEMKRLRDLSQETVLIHIRNGVERLCLDELQSLHEIKYVAGKGKREPIYTGSAGKVLLSKLPDNELRGLLNIITLSPLTPWTITDKDILLRDVIKARDEGYAASFGERAAGSASISVPINNYVCPVALSVLGPEDRFSSKMMGLLDELKLSVARISKGLEGFVPAV